MAKRQYIKLTAAQTAALEAEFSRGKYANKQRCDALSENLGVPAATIKVWFQNQRVKAKKISSQSGDTASLPQHGDYKHANEGMNAAELQFGYQGNQAMHPYLPSATATGAFPQHSAYQHANQGMNVAAVQNGYQGGQQMPTTNQQAGYPAYPMPGTQQQQGYSYGPYDPLQPHQEVAPPPNVSYGHGTYRQPQPQPQWNDAHGIETSMTQFPRSSHDTQTYNPSNPAHLYGSSTFQQNYPNYQQNNSNMVGTVTRNTNYAMNGYNGSDNTFKAAQPTGNDWSQPPANGYVNQLLEREPLPPPTGVHNAASQQWGSREVPMTQCITNPQGCSTAQMGQKRRTRTKFTAFQQSQLEARYAVSNTIEGQEKKDLAERLGLKPATIRFYFKNRRAAEKQKDSEKTEGVCTSEVVQDVATVTKELVNDNEKSHNLTVEGKREEKLMQEEVPSTESETLPNKTLLGQVDQPTVEEEQEEGNMYMDMPDFEQMQEEVPLTESKTPPNKTLLGQVDQQPTIEEKQKEKEVCPDMQVQEEVPLTESKTPPNETLSGQKDQQPTIEEKQKEKEVSPDMMVQEEVPLTESKTPPNKTLSGQKDQQRTIEEKQEEKEECPDMQVQVDLLAQDLCLSSDDED